MCKIFMVTQSIYAENDMSPIIHSPARLYQTLAGAQRWASEHALAIQTELVELNRSKEAEDGLDLTYTLKTSGTNKTEMRIAMAYDCSDETELHVVIDITETIVYA